MKITSFRQFKKAIRSFLLENKEQIVYGEGTIDIINSFEKRYHFLDIFTQTTKFFEKQKGALFDTFCTEFYLYYLKNGYDVETFYKNMNFFLIYPSEPFYNMFF